MFGIGGRFEMLVFVTLESIMLPVERFGFKQDPREKATFMRIYVGTATECWCLVCYQEMQWTRTRVVVHKVIAP